MTETAPHTSAPAGSGSSAPRTSAAWIALLLVLVTAGVYARALQNQFVGWDDEPYVTENDIVQQGLTAESIAWAFDMRTEHGGNWHPLTSMSHMLDIELFGLDPAGHHGVNVVLHALNAALLFGFLLAATRRMWPAALTAALFALHPLHVESVAWVSERKDVLSTAFGIGALWAYTSWARASSGRTGRYVLALALFAMGLMSKPMLVTWPFLLLLLDHWPLGRWPGTSVKRLIVEKLPFFALSLGSALVTFFVQRTAGAVTNSKVTFPHRMENVVISYVRYLGKTVWPDEFSCLYPHAYGLAGNPWPWWGLALGVLLLLTLTVLTLRKRYATVGWLWYLGTLVPVIGIVQVGSQGMADRYTYVPLIGVFVIVSYGLCELVASRAHTEGAGPSGKARLVGALAVLVLAGLSVRTWFQIGVWKTTRTLFENAMRVEPSPITVSNLGGEYEKLGLHDLALEALYKAIAISPEHPPGHFNLGVVLHKDGQLAQAEAAYRDTLALDPNHWESRRNLGIILLDTGRNEDAVIELRVAEALKPDDADTHFKLGQAWRAIGQEEAAVRSLREALRLNTEQAAARLELGTLLEGRGEYEDAEFHLRKAVDLDPYNHIAHYNLGVTLSRRGKQQEAMEAYRAALRIEPGYARAHNNLGNALRARHEFEAAIPHYKALATIEPENPRPHRELGLIYSSLKKDGERIHHLREAVRLGDESARKTLAWALATVCGEEHRKPDEALSIMNDIVRALGGPADVGSLDVLAAAQAASGRFADAVTTVEQALTRADERQRAVLQQRLELYRAETPYVNCR